MKPLRSLLLLISVMAANGCERATSGSPIPRYQNPTTALLLLDLQRDFLRDDGRLPVSLDQVSPMISAANELVIRHEALGLQLAYITNEFEPWDYPSNWFRRGAAIRDAPGTALDPRLQVVNQRPFAKKRADAFSNSELDRFLRSNEVNHVVLLGVFADACVFYTAQGALNRGYRVTVLRDAVAAARSEERGRALAQLERLGVTISNTADFISGIGDRGSGDARAG